MFTYLQITDLPYNQTSLGLAAFGHNNLESLCSSIRQRLRSLIYDADVSGADGQINWELLGTSAQLCLKSLTYYTIRHLQA